MRVVCQPRASVCALLLGLAGSVSGQEPPASDPGVAEEEDTSRNTLVPLPVLFYQPETGTGFGAAASYYFHLAPAIGSDRIQPSTIGAVAIYTVKKQVIALASSEFYLARGLYRLTVEGGYERFPTKFWGIGNEAPATAEEEFTPASVALSVELQRQVAAGWFVGGSVRVGHRRLVETTTGGLLETGAVPGARDGRIVNLGFVGVRDTRKNVVSPRSGGYHQIGTTLYTDLFGSEFGFTTFELDFRQYVPLPRSHVVGLRALVIGSAGTPPFDLMPQLGGDALLRGYFSGRFRDRYLFALQSEYRMPVFWRIGIVGFVETGQVTDDITGFALRGFKVSAGGGIRFILSRREGLAIRADVGWGFDTGSGGFYLGIGEAF